MPGLPNTGDGGTSGGAGGSGAPIIGLALVVSTAIAAGVALRRRAA